MYIPGEIIHIRRSKTRFGKNEDEEGDTEEEQEEIDERRESIKVADVLNKFKTTFSLYHSTHEISNEMKFTKTCIEDHMINSYNDAFVYLREQYPAQE